MVQVVKIIGLDQYFLGTFHHLTGQALYGPIGDREAAKKYESYEEAKADAKKLLNRFWSLCRDLIGVDGASGLS